MNNKDDKLNIALVVGARPNFVKAAPLYEILSKESDIQVSLIHTGQHFDAQMSAVFFDQLGMPKPDVYLDINQGSPIEQISKVMVALEKEFINMAPDLVLVFGDVNATLAASITANKLNLPLAHVEAGLRSFDLSMPEEHNRVITDHLADYLFTPSADANKNLAKEGIEESKIHLVGNIMVDSLLRFLPHAKSMQSSQKLKLPAQGYGLVTLHRPANVDDKKSMTGILEAIQKISEELPIVFPVHPRTRARMKELGLLEIISGSEIMLLEPLGYLEFMNLMINARIVLTDSGGIQEETTVLGVPCITIRENTERPITITQGSNILAGVEPQGIISAYQDAMGKAKAAPNQIELWDGKTAERITEIIKAQFKI